MVGLYEDQVVAMGALTVSDNKAEIKRMRVHPDYQRRGYGQAILEQLQFYKLAHKTDRTYQLWQEGSHPEQILNETMMREKLEYLHHNPVRRGYVEDPRHWRYSSARNYAGMEALLTLKGRW